MMQEVFEALDSVAAQLVACNDAADPRSWSGEQAAAVVATAARIKNAAAALEAMAAARVAATGAWRRDGSPTAADWLARRSGATANQARQRLDTGLALVGGLDATAAKAKAGELSPEQAAAIADAASANPAAEDRLLAAASTESLGELRDRCKQQKRLADADPDATYARLRRQRSCHRYADGEGLAHLHWSSTADDAAVLGSTLDAITDELFQQARRDGRTEPHDAYAADALVEMARRATGGGSGRTRGARPAERFLGLIRADLGALVRGSVEEGELCEITGIGPIPVSRARALLGESILKLVLTRGRDANVTHLGRGANAAQRVALLWRSPTCSVLGCNRRARLEIDHVEPFATVRETSLDNLDPKCDHHHDLKTYEGWASVPGDGRRPLVPPDDPRHPRHRRPPHGGSEQLAALVG